MTGQSSTAIVVVPASGSSSLDVPASIADHARVLLEAARSPETARAYQARWRSWEAFCASTGATVLPASPEALGAFLTAAVLAGKSLSWVGQACAAVRLSHERAGHPSPTEHPAVRTLLKGARRVHGKPAEGKQELALAALRTLVAAMPRSSRSPRVLRDRCLILLGWWSALRRGELVALEVEDITERDEGLVLRIRRSKTDASGRGSRVAVPRAQSANLCACEALRAWRSASGITRGPLFRAVGPDGSLSDRALHPQAVAVILKRYLRLADMTPAQFAAHSLRSGFATEAARQGRPIERIAEHLRHGSIQTTTKYVRAGRVLEDAVGRGLA